MTAPEVAPPSGLAPAVSVLVTTYNRSALLRRALESVRKQDFQDFEIVVVDDQSPDDTPQVMAEYVDPRIRYIRNADNMAHKGGDRSIFEQFVKQQTRGEFFLWLCDDDYWVPSDLLSRQVRIMRQNPNVAMIFGGMAQLWPTTIPLPTPNQPHLSYEYVGDRRDITFARCVFPNGFLPSETYLELFAEDPANRNSVTGGTMFRASSFRRANALAHGQQVRWQSGYLMLAGTATMGDVWYLDEPCIVATVELESASYRGSQLDHMLDCMRSIDAAFHVAMEDSHSVVGARIARIRAKMMHSTFQTYLANKLSYRFGWFAGNPLQGVEKIFLPEISSAQFLEALRTYDVPVSWKNWIAIRYSSLWFPLLRAVNHFVVHKLGFENTWWKRLMQFADAQGPGVTAQLNSSMKSDA